MGVFAVAVIAALAAKGKKAGPKLDPACQVVSISVDGSEEPRECYSMGVDDLKPGCASNPTAATRSHAHPSPSCLLTTAANTDTGLRASSSPAPNDGWTTRRMHTCASG